MPALPTVVTDYLTAVKNALSTGSDLGSNVRGAARNYLRAADMATVLDLLQNALDQSSPLTAVSGSTRTVVDGAATFVPGSQVGNIVVFTGNNTPALAGVEAVVADNNHNTLTFTELLVASPVAGDTYTIRGAMVDAHIDALRQGKSLADSPPGSLYGDGRVVRDALVRMIERVGMVAATGTLTFTGNASDTETVTIGTKVYTFQTVLTDVDGNVLIGATASDSLDNLIAAIGLGAGAGTNYATSTTLNADVTAAAGPGDTMDVTAKAVVGPAGNSIATTSTVTGGTWGAATLTGGAFGSLGARVLSHPSLVTAAGSTTTVIALNTLGIPLVLDQWRGYTLTVSGESRRILTNDADTATLTAALTSAPGSSVPVSITVPENSVESPARAQLQVHAGQQPGENAMLSTTINTLQTLVAAFTLPT